MAGNCKGTMEVRATCSCGWKSKKVHNDPDVTVNHRAALLEWAAHSRATHNA